jgi:hypothetical protein
MSKDKFKQPTRKFKAEKGQQKERRETLEYEESAATGNPTSPTILTREKKKVT